MVFPLIGIVFADTIYFDIVVRGMHHQMQIADGVTSICDREYCIFSMPFRSGCILELDGTCIFIARVRDALPWSTLIIADMDGIMYLIRRIDGQFQPIDTIAIILGLEGYYVGIFIAIPLMINVSIRFRTAILVLRIVRFGLRVCPITLLDAICECFRSFSTDKHFSAPMNRIIFTKRTLLYCIIYRIYMQAQYQYTIAPYSVSAVGTSACL